MSSLAGRKEIPPDTLTFIILLALRVREVKGLH